jgi:hypothetical protein
MHHSPRHLPAIYMYTYMYIHIHIHIYVRICMSVNMIILTYVCIYICINMYIYKYSHRYNYQYMRHSPRHLQLLQSSNKGCQKYTCIHFYNYTFVHINTCKHFHIQLQIIYTSMYLYMHHFPRHLQPLQSSNKGYQK